MFGKVVGTVTETVTETAANTGKRWILDGNNWVRNTNTIIGNGSNIASKISNTTTKSADAIAIAKNISPKTTENITEVVSASNIPGKATENITEVVSASNIPGKVTEVSDIVNSTATTSRLTTIGTTIKNTISKIVPIAAVAGISGFLGYNISQNNQNDTTETITNQTKASIDPVKKGSFKITEITNNETSGETTIKFNSQDNYCENDTIILSETETTPNINGIKYYIKNSPSPGVLIIITGILSYINNNKLGFIDITSSTTCLSKSQEKNKSQSGLQNINQMSTSSQNNLILYNTTYLYIFLVILLILFLFYVL